MSCKYVVISGIVQGVGFRDWMLVEAQRLGLSGWVRNRNDGSVDALVSGEADAVEEMLRACRSGPRAAQVTSIEEELASPPDEPGFYVRFTV